MLYTCCYLFDKYLVLLIMAIYEIKGRWKYFYGDHNNDNISSKWPKRIFII